MHSWAELSRCLDQATTINALHPKLQGVPRARFREGPLSDYA